MAVKVFQNSLVSCITCATDGARGERVGGLERACARAGRVVARQGDRVTGQRAIRAGLARRAIKWGGGVAPP